MSLPLKITSRQAFETVEGFTHASSVIAEVSCREAVLGMSTRWVVPLNESAPLNLPEVVQVAPTIEPVLLLPEASVTVVPEPWSKE